jgi:hypothetical protein
LGIFSRIKPLILLEGNVLDSYRYPEEGSTPKGSILRLPQYLHFFFKDMGYENIVFYDSLRGFYNNCEEGYLERFGELTESTVAKGCIRADFKNAARNDGAAAIVRRSICQSEQSTVIVMDFASRYITSPDRMDQCEVDSFTVLLQASLEAKDVKTQGGQVLKNLLVLVGSRETVQRMIDNNRKTLRYTGLRAFLTMGEDFLL